MTTALFFFTLAHLSNYGMDQSRESREMVSSIVNPVLARGTVENGLLFVGILVEQLGE